MAQNRVSFETPAEKLNFLAHEMVAMMNNLTSSLAFNCILESTDLRKTLADYIFKMDYSIEKSVIYDAHMHTSYNFSMFFILVTNHRFDLLRIIYDIYSEELASLPLIQGNDPSFNDLLFFLKQKATYIIDKNDINYKGAVNSEQKQLLKLYINIFNNCLRPRPFDITVAPLDLEAILEKLFGNKPEYLPIEASMAKIIQLFSHPAKYVPYLQFIEQEFNRYNVKHCGKPFPQLAANKYDFKLINGYEYPIPNENFGEGLTKLSLLQEFLMIFLRQTAGWGKKNTALNWLGHIPNELANKLLLADSGTFVTEGRLNEGLYHGKLSHMLQFAVIAVAIQDNFISNVTLHELIDFAIQHDEYASKNKIWLSMFDWYSISRFTLSNPFALHTLLMRHGHGELNTPSIATYLIDTFCKGFNRLVQMEYQNNHSISKNKFLDNLQYFSFNMFSTPHDTTIQYLKKHYPKYYAKATHTSLRNDYFVIEKKYKPKHFAVNPYPLFAAERLKKVTNQETTANTEIKNNHTSTM